MQLLKGECVTAAPKNDASESHNFGYQAFIAKYAGATLAKYPAGVVIYRQGDRADAAFYVVSGSVKVAFISEHGKEAVLALLKAGDFFGVECLAPGLLRNPTITTTSHCEIVRIDRNTLARALGEDLAFARLFLAYVVNQNDKLREDLVDQLFNSSEKRLARILLTLANSGPDDQSNEIAIPVTQETLANMVGTTRSRINQFMTKFRKLGYIDYNSKIRVHNSLMNIISEDQAQPEVC